MGKQKIAVLDLDGVVLNSRCILDEIHTLGLTGDDMWKYFYTNCNADRVHVIDNALELIQLFYDAGVEIAFSTARNEKCKEETRKKLWQHGITSDLLYMRKDGDLRPSPEVKKEHLEEISKKYDIILFVDDELSNCETAKSMGIMSLRRV